MRSLLNFPTAAAVVCVSYTRKETPKNTTTMARGRQTKNNKSAWGLPTALAVESGRSFHTGQAIGVYRGVEVLQCVRKRKESGKKGWKKDRKNKNKTTMNEHISHSNKKTLQTQGRVKQALH